MRRPYEAMTVAILAALAATGAVACVASGAVTPEGRTAGITYYRDVEPILQARCVQCHQEGGSAPVALTSWAQANFYRSFIQRAVEDGTMPPWLPAPGCNEYVGDRSLTADEIATLSGWADLGGPAGYPVERSRPETASSVLASRDGLVTIEMPTWYTPAEEQIEHRCFLSEWPVGSPTFVTGFEALPVDTSAVRRVTAYVVQPGKAEDLVARDEGDPGPGWACLGTPDAATSWLGGWTAGSAAAKYPRGTGLAVPPGASIVLEITYDTRETPASADLTTVAFGTIDAVRSEARILAWADPEWFLFGKMPIPAGQTDVAHSFVADPSSSMRGGAVTIHAMTLQMRALGTGGSLSIRRSTGEVDCLLDLPSWEPGWQEMESLARPVTVSPGDEVAVECHWDNGPGEDGRRLVDDEPRVPADSNWGDEAGDEMCLALLYATES